MANDDDGKGNGNGKLEWEDAEEASYSAFQTLRAIVLFLIVAAMIAAAIGLLSTAPWMRVSFDCSIFCVIELDIREFFS